MRREGLCRHATGRRIDGCHAGPQGRIGGRGSNARGPRSQAASGRRRSKSSGGPGRSPTRSAAGRARAQLGTPSPISGLRQGHAAAGAAAPAARLFRGRPATPRPTTAQARPGTEDRLGPRRAEPRAVALQTGRRTCATRLCPTPRINSVLELQPRGIAGFCLGLESIPVECLRVAAAENPASGGMPVPAGCRCSSPRTRRAASLGPGRPRARGGRARRTLTARTGTRVGSRGSPCSRRP